MALVPSGYLNADQIAVHVDDSGETGHPESGSQLIDVHSTWLQDAVHVLYGVFDGSSREQVFLAQQLDDACCDEVAHATNALLEGVDNLSIDVFGCDVAEEVVVWDGVVGRAADVYDLRALA